MIPNPIKLFIDLLLNIFGERLVGYRTKIFALGSVLTVVYDFISKDLSAVLCENYHVACDLPNQKYWHVIVVIMATVTYIMRNFSNTPAGNETRLLKRFKKGYKEEVRLLRLKRVA